MSIENTKILAFLNVGIGYYDSVEAVDKAAGKTGECLRLANVYMGQKQALVDARSWLVERINEAAPTFLADPKKDRKVETKDKAGNVTGNKTVNDETEGEFIKRFVANAATVGHVKALTVTKEDGKTASVAAKTLHTPADAQAWLQSVVDAHGVFANDAKHAERGGKPKTPPQYALNAARTVLTGKTAEALATVVAKWTKEFATRNINHGPFNTEDEATNITNFAWAAAAREEQRLAERTAAEYK